MTSDLIVALDIGTSSVRGSIYNMRASRRPETFVKHERTLASTDDGGAEIDADAALEQVVKVIDQVIKKARHIDGEIVAAATSSFWHSLMGIDARGRPTTKVFGWADTRSRDQVAELRRGLDESAAHNRTGARFHPSYWPAKLLWLRRKCPSVFRRTAKWISFSDYVGLRLFGLPTPELFEGDKPGKRPNARVGGKQDVEVFTSVSMASATGIFDIRKCDWDEQMLAFLGVSRDQLPKVLAGNDRYFLIGESYRRRWKRLGSTKFFAAIGDGAANNIGCGCVTKSKAALMVGTSGAMRVAYKGEPPETIPSGLWCYRIDRERVIMGGALSDGGGLYKWLKDNLKLDKSDDQIESEIAARPPAAHGLVFLPFLAGERSTGYNASAAGAVAGLKASTEAIDIVQAALESVAFRFAAIFDQLRTTSRVREVIASGGALRASPAWTQIIADVLGRSLSLPDVQEASSRGAVLLALESIGRIDNIENDERPPAKAFSPRSAANRIYKKARRRHAKFYDLILNTDQ